MKQHIAIYWFYRPTLQKSTDIRIPLLKHGYTLEVALLNAIVLMVQKQYMYLVWYMFYFFVGMTLMKNKLEEFKCDANEVITFKLSKFYSTLSSC